MVQGSVVEINETNSEKHYVVKNGRQTTTVSESEIVKKLEASHATASDFQRWAKESETYHNFADKLDFTTTTRAEDLELGALNRFWEEATGKEIKNETSSRWKKADDEDHNNNKISSDKISPETNQSDTHSFELPKNENGGQTNGNINEVILSEKTPEKIDFYLSVPNADGSFNRKNAKAGYSDGASIFAVQNIGNNRYELFINKRDNSRKLALEYPDVTLYPVFDAISAYKPNTELQTVKPAVLQLDGEKFTLVSKGEFDYDSEGINRENNKIKAARFTKIEPDNSVIENSDSEVIAAKTNVNNDSYQKVDAGKVSENDVVAAAPLTANEKIVADIPIENNFDVIEPTSVETAIGRKLGRELLAEIAVKDAEFKLRNFEKDSKTEIHFLQVKIDGQIQKKTTSFEELELARRAFAVSQLETDREAGILQMIAESSNRKVEAVEQERFENALTEARIADEPWIKAITDHQDKTRGNLVSNLEEAKTAHGEIQKETKEFTAKFADGQTSEIKPHIQPEVLWNEQLKAAERGDAETFVKLEELHQQLNIPRPNDIYSRLRGLETMATVRADFEDKTLRDNLKEQNFSLDEKITLELEADETDVNLIKTNILDFVAKQKELSEDLPNTENMPENSIERKIARIAELEREETEIYLPSNKTVIKAGYDRERETWYLREIDATKSADTYITSDYKYGRETETKHIKEDWIIREISVKKDADGKLELKNSFHTDPPYENQEDFTISRNFALASEKITTGKADDAISQINGNIAADIHTPEYFTAKTKRSAEKIDESFAGQVKTVDKTINNLFIEANQKKRDAESERSLAKTKAWQPIRHMVDPFSPVAGKLAWFTRPADTLNRHINPVEIFRNDPAIQIVRAVWNYVEHNGNAKQLNKTADELLEKANSLKGDFRNGDWQNAKKTANAVENAIKAEETLRTNLKADPQTNNALLETPERSLTDSEIKKIGEVSARTGNGELLNNYYESIQEDANLAKTIGVTDEKLASDVFMSELRVAEACNQAIDNFTVGEGGIIEIKIDAGRLAEAGKMMEVNQVTSNWQKILSENENLSARLSLQETAEAERLMNPLNRPDELQNFVKDQYIRLNDEIQATQTQAMNQTEQRAFEELNFSETQKLELNRIETDNTRLDYLSGKANGNSMSEVQYQDVGQTFTVENPNDVREEEAKKFWKDDRAEREQQIADEKAESKQKQTEEEIEMENAAEAEEIEAIEAAEEEEIIAAILA